MRFRVMIYFFGVRIVQIHNFEKTNYDNYDEIHIPHIAWVITCRDTKLAHMGPNLNCSTCFVTTGYESTTQFEVVNCMIIL